MDLHINSDLQAKLIHLAAQQGRATDSLVQDALTRYLEDQGQFLEGVERGLAASDNGDFVEEDQMDARFDRMLQF